MILKRIFNVGFPSTVYVDIAILSAVLEGTCAMGKCNWSSSCCSEYNPPCPIGIRQKRILFRAADARKPHVPAHEIRTAEAAQKSSFHLPICLQIEQKTDFREACMLVKSHTVYTPHWCCQCMKSGPQDLSQIAHLARPFSSIGLTSKVLKQP